MERSKDADRDLLDIYLHGAAKFGVGQSETYLAKLAACMNQVAMNPLRSTLRTEFRPPVRLFSCGSHLLVYLISNDNAVVIVRILHKRMTLPDWLSRQTLTASH